MSSNNNPVTAALGGGSIPNLSGGAAAPSAVVTGDKRFGDVIIGSNKWLVLAVAGVSLWYIHKKFKK